MSMKEKLKPVPLTKEESLSLMAKRFAALSAQSDFQDAINSALAKYGISFNTHTLDLNRGLFVPKTESGKHKGGHKTFSVPVTNGKQVN